MAKTPTPSAASLAAAAPASAVPVAEPTDLPATYEAGLRELEALVRRIESGDLALDDLLGTYKRGALLLTFCREKLEAIEAQVKVLDGTLLKPWSPGGIGKS
jgi:exodeoxyribonuclease VII small subunit